MKGEKMLSRNSVRVFLKQNGKRIASDTFAQLDQEVKEMLLKAVKRSGANHRSTVMPQDL